MPKMVKTKTFGSTRSYPIVLQNVAEALANVLGTEVGKTTNSNSDTIYYISMKNVGYDGWFWCIRVDTGSAGHYFIATDESGLPRLSDETVYPLIDTGMSGLSVSINAVTAVLFRDVNNDTVLINVHSGSSENGVGDTYYDVAIGTAFFGKDENNDVLCGIGKSNILGVRTTDKYIDVTKSDIYNASNIYPGSQRLLGDTLHLTKMVNYLSPTMPEMKSAYITIVRPDGDDAKPLNPSFYADGALWGVVGEYDCDRSGSKDFPPFQPFVKY